MNPILPSTRSWMRTAAGAVALLLAPPLDAFPPAPHHVVFGLVRDEQGTPLESQGAAVILETDGGAVVQSTLIPGLEPGVNYRLTIPLDSGVTSDPYKPTALQPTVPFRLKVRIGTTTYLPIEMVGAGALLTRPGEITRLDLTLGEDLDGDGLPDAWERVVLAARGQGGTIADIRPEDDADGDGLSNLQEYLAGTYAFDPADGFALSIVGVEGPRSLLEFTAIRGRTYTVEGSADLAIWQTLEFRMSTEGAAVPARSSYEAKDVRPLRILVGPFAEDLPQPRFFRLVVR